MVGDEQRVEPELLDLAGERLDATRSVAAVALPDVGGQEDPEPFDLTHGRCNLASGGSAAAVLRFTLLDERPRSFEQVVRGKDPNRRLDLGLMARGEVPVECVVHEALDLADGQRAAERDLLADRPGTGERLAGRHDLVDEPDALRLPPR